MEEYKRQIKKFKDELSLCRKHSWKAQIAFEVDGNSNVPDCVYNYIKTLNPSVRTDNRGRAEVKVAQLNESELEFVISLLEMLLVDDTDKNPEKLSKGNKK